MKSKTIAITPLLLGLIVLGLHQNARAESGDIALGAKISTLGVGPDLTICLFDGVNLRAAGHWGSFDLDGEGEDIEYDCDVDLLSGLVTAEWSPFMGSFHIAAGALFNGNSMDASADISAGRTYNIGGTYYTATEIGRLEGDIDYDNVAPYVGIGWRNPVDQDSGFTFFVDLGVAYQGAAEVNLDAYGTLANDPTFRRRLQQEEDDLEDDLDDYRYYPVISLGLAYTF